MTSTPDGLDDLAAAYIGLWRDYVAQLSHAQSKALPTGDPAAMVNAGAEAWQKALSAYGQAFTSASESASGQSASTGASSDDGNDVVRQLHERIDALEKRLAALEGNG